MKVTETSRNVLRLIERKMPSLYAFVEEETEYHYNDDFKNEKAWDNAVDEAELKTLCKILLGEIQYSNDLQIQV